VDGEDGFPFEEGEEGGFGLVYTETREAVFSLNKDSIRAERDIYLNNDIYYGEGAMEYKRITKTDNGVKNTIGYDLYIKS
jgi:hypothetical protein